MSREDCKENNQDKGENLRGLIGQVLNAVTAAPYAIKEAAFN